MRWLLVVALAACRGTDRPNVLLIDVDSLRADRVGGAREGIPLMPNVEALARRGTQFDVMVAQSGWTVPSLQALLTGKPPIAALTDAPARNVAWMSSDRTVAEVLDLYDYRTAVFYGPTLVNRLPVFRRGFDEVDQIDPDHPRPARDVVSWLASGPAEPWFALVHETDIHQIPELARADRDRYEPDHPEPCMDAAPDDPDYTRVVDAWSSTLGIEAARDLAVAHYDAAATHADARVGRIVEELRDRGYERRTVIVFTSNHGEELFEHGELTHAKPYEFDLRVPLVVYDPRESAHTARVSTVVQTIDLAPTILDLAGIPIDRAMEGQSLVPLLRGGEGYTERSVISISSGHRVSIRTPARHLVRCAQPGCPPTMDRERTESEPVYELYDPIADPGEVHDLAAAEPETLGELRRALDGFVSSRQRGPAEATSSVPDSFLQALRERGYWSPDE